VDGEFEEDIARKNFRCIQVSGSDDPQSCSLSLLRFPDVAIFSIEEAEGKSEFSLALALSHSRCCIWCRYIHQRVESLLSLREREQSSRNNSEETEEGSCIHRHFQRGRFCRKCIPFKPAIPKLTRCQTDQTYTVQEQGIALTETQLDETAMPMTPLVPTQKNRAFWNVGKQGDVV
jgi:hypothetical protein